GRRTLRFPSEADDRETLDRLTEMGFRRALETSALVRRWDTGSYGALKGGFARSQLAEIVPMLLQHFARSANPDAAVVAFVPVACRAARRRAAVFAAATESRSDRPDRARAWRRATTCRQPRSVSGGHGRGHRPELLWRAARRNRVRGRPRALAQPSRLV